MDKYVYMNIYSYMNIYVYMNSYIPNWLKSASTGRGKY